MQRRLPESNRSAQLCRLLPNHSAKAPHKSSGWAIPVSAGGPRDGGRPNTPSQARTAQPERTASNPLSITYRTLLRLVTAVLAKQTFTREPPANEEK